MIKLSQAQSVKNPPWDLLAFHPAAAARNGLVALAPITDTGRYTVISTNYMRMPHDGKISYMTFRTAGIGNFVRGDIKLDTLQDYIGAYFATDQTSQLIGIPDLLPVDLSFKNGDLLSARADNANNSQIDACYVFIGVGNQPIIFTDKPEAGSIPYKATATQACVADTWTDTLTVTWDKTFDKDKFYKITGLMGHSATGYAMRLLYTHTKRRPGCLVGDTEVLQRPLFGDFGTFKGNASPNLEWLASGTDGDVYATVWIKEL